MDHPNPPTDAILTPPFISTWNSMCGGATFQQNRFTPGTRAWDVANQAVYIPMYLPWQYNVARIFWTNGSSAGGNSDAGIYTATGKALFTVGSTVCSGANAHQYTNVGMILNAGNYFLAFTHSVTTANHVNGNLVTSGQMRIGGCYLQTSALPLPSQATFAAITTTAVYPLMGITRMATASGM